MRCALDEGRWRFCLELGAPVPAEYLAETSLDLAGKHLIEQMLPHFESHPEQCPKYLLDHFKEVSTSGVTPRRT
jgi:hypothetical protein